MNISTRLTAKPDDECLAKWFTEKGILRGFPMQTNYEIQDSIRIWMYHVGLGAGVTAEVDGKVAGMIVLYINPFQKLSHACLFSIVVNPEFRRLGVATRLLQEAEKLAKEKFNIEILHLEVYQENDRAYKLYEKLGFKSYGVQKKFIKENGSYLDKVLMQKKL